MATYAECTRAVYLMRDTIMKKHHRHLIEAGVTVKMLFVHAPIDEKTGEPKGPALKNKGYPAAGLAEINSHKARMKGCDDATIYLDGDTWSDWTEARQLALIDHELTHFQVDLDAEEGVKLDAGNRPKLTMRLHDWEIGGFQDVSDRHGAAALDVETARAAVARHRRVFLDRVDHLDHPRLAAVAE